MIEFGQPHKILDMKVKGDEWIVDGYASTFNEKDDGDDIVVPGAYERTLANGRKKRFLHSHDMRMVLGLPKFMDTDKKGLVGRYKISKTRLGEDTRTLLLDGAIDSFSIGYRAVDFEHDEKSGARILKDVELYEVSLVAIPMNQGATVTNVKSWMEMLGIDGADMTLAEKAAYLADALNDLLRDTRGLVDGIDKPLSNTKRREFADLLETFSGLDAVRSEMKTVLAAAPRKTNVDAVRVLHGLHRRRRELAHLIEE